MEVQKRLTMLKTERQTNVYLIRTVSIQSIHDCNTIQYNTISFILRRIQIIVNISSFELFTDNKYNTIIIQIYNNGMQHNYIHVSSIR